MHAVLHTLIDLDAWLAEAAASVAYLSRTFGQSLETFRRPVSHEETEFVVRHHYPWIEQPKRALDFVNETFGKSLLTPLRKPRRGHPSLSRAPCVRPTISLS